jgi:hypothetical protein
MISSQSMLLSNEVGLGCQIGIKKRVFERDSLNS